LELVGSQLHATQEHEAALRYFQRATQLNPGFAYAYTLSGHEYFACEDFEQARRLYETALSVDRRHYNAWYGIGQIDFRQEKYELAATHFQRAMEARIQSPPLILCFRFLSFAISIRAAVSALRLKYNTALIHIIMIPMMRQIGSLGCRRCTTGE
jgi:tetratricopeptide (TPR) repeat protein